VSASPNGPFEVVCHRTVIKDTGPKTELPGRLTKGLHTEPEMGRGSKHV